MSDPNNPPVDPGGVGQPTGTESPTNAPSAPSGTPDATPTPDGGGSSEPTPPASTPEPTPVENPTTDVAGTSDTDEDHYQRYKRHQERYERERDNVPEPPPVVDEGRELNVGPNDGDSGNAEGGGTPEATETPQPVTRVRQAGFRNRGRRRYTNV